MRLLLVRHAQTADNARGVLSSAIPGPHLTEVGRQQANALGAELSEDAIQAVYSSRTFRAQETAKPLAAQFELDVRVIGGLQEIDAGELEGRADEGAVRAYFDTTLQWLTDPSVRLPGGENGTEFLARYTRAIDRIAERGGESVVVVSHGRAIRVWATHMSVNLDADFGRVHPVDNTVVVHLVGSPTSGWLATRWAGEAIN